MEFLIKAKSATGHLSRLLGSFSAWKYSNWVIAFLLGLAALMATLNNFGWALVFLVASGLAAAFSSWRSQAVTRQVKLGKKYQSRPVLGYRILALVVIAIVWGIPGYYMAKKIHIAPTTTGPLGCQVMAATFSPIYRFYQEPPVYFERLDAGVRTMLTNETDRPMYLRSYSVSALVGIQWVKFKNADSAAFEPYAFGEIVTKESQSFIGRYDLSDNSFDYIMQRGPLPPGEAKELWMFFISGLSAKNLKEISQFRFVFHDSANKELSCVSDYSIASDRGIVMSRHTGDLKVLGFEPAPPNLREEPPH
jgi:hypothetical protein